MPRGDRTGPQGGGSRTGRAAGYCAGNDSPGYMNQAETMRGGGGFRGRRGMADELDMLRGDAERLEIELAAVKDRMKKLESK
jgi:hypothetical protein